jgi:hypothetical protein
MTEPEAPRTKAHHIVVDVGDDLIHVGIFNEDDRLLAVIAEYRRDQLDRAKAHGIVVASALDFPLYERDECDDELHLVTLP